MSHAVLNAEELRARLDSDSPPVVIDVREAEELEIVSLKGALHVPMSEFEASVRALDPHQDYVIVCHHGIRSAEAAGFMVQYGFTRVANLLGGLDSWACEVDPTMPRY